MINNFYTKRVIKFPRITLFLLLCSVVFLALYIPKLSVDASAETLLLENDKDLIYTRDINARYATPDFLVITYTPKTPLLSDTSLKNLKALVYSNGAFDFESFSPFSFKMVPVQTTFSKEILSNNKIDKTCM